MTVNYEAADGVAVLTLDRPDKLNSVTTAMSERLFGLIGEIDSDDAVRAVVVTGAGPRSFCVGSDIAEVDAYPDPWQFRNRRDYCDALRALRKPVIAAVNGYAYGGGLELALSCDIRLASTTASFAAAEIKLGWIGGGGVSALLAASVPASDAALLLLTGDPVDAAEARRIGLVSRVYSPGELVAAARSLASVIASGRRSRPRRPRPTCSPPGAWGWSRLSSTSGRCRLSAWGPGMPPRDVRPSRRSGPLTSPVTEERT